MKLFQPVRRVFRYFRYDLKEIVLPSSLPDPPEYVTPRRLTLAERWKALKHGTNGYLDTWKQEPEEAEGTTDSGSTKQDADQPQMTVMEELGAGSQLRWKLQSKTIHGQDPYHSCAAATARSSAGMKPVLTRLYQRNMAVLQRSVANFIQGYREGAAEKVDISHILPRGWDSQANSSHQPGNASQSPAVNADSTTTSNDSRLQTSSEGQQEELMEDQGSGTNSVRARAHSERPAISSKNGEAAKDVLLANMAAAFDARGQPGNMPERKGCARKVDKVAEALADAEQIAVRMLGASPPSLTQQRQLAEAVRRVEAAMKAGEADSSKS